MTGEAKRREEMEGICGEEHGGQTVGGERGDGGEQRWSQAGVWKVLHVAHTQMRSLTGLPEGWALPVRAAEGYEFSHPK